MMFEQRFCASFSFKKCKCNCVFILLSIKCSLHEKWRIFLLKNKEQGHSRKHRKLIIMNQRGQSKLYIFASDTRGARKPNP